MRESSLLSRLMRSANLVHAVADADDATFKSWHVGGGFHTELWHSSQSHHTCTTSKSQPIKSHISAAILFCGRSFLLEGQDFFF